jgi:peptidoglycan/LPS O-acetylase OafA/YrhL
LKSSSSDRRSGIPNLNLNQSSASSPAIAARAGSARPSIPSRPAASRPSAEPRTPAVDARRPPEALARPGASDRPTVPGGGRRHYAAIEGLRAIAAGAILLHHFLLAHPLSTALLPYTHHLEFGVPVFFVISGFVLYRPWVGVGLATIDAGALLRYGRRRVARIVPAFWVALTLAAAGGLSEGRTGAHPLTYYGFLQVYSIHTAFNGLGVAWSLGTELTFYAVLPLLAIGAIRIGGKRSLAVAAILVIATLGVRYLSFSENLPALAFTLAGTLDWFVIGMGLATVAVRRPQWIARVNPAGALAAGVGLLLAMGALRLPWGVIAYNANPTAGGSITAHLFYGAIGLMFVLAATSAEQRRSGIVPRLLRNRAAIWLGTVSYGIYLWHVPVIGAVTSIVGRGWLPSNAGVQLVAVALGTTLVASLSWVLLERPIVRSRLVRGARVPSPATAPA